MVHLYQFLYFQDFIFLISDLIFFLDLKCFLILKSGNTYKLRIFVPSAFFNHNEEKTPILLSYTDSPYLVFCLKQQLLINLLDKWVSCAYILTEVHFIDWKSLCFCWKRLCSYMSDAAWSNNLWQKLGLHCQGHKRIKRARYNESKAQYLWCAHIQGTYLYEEKKIMNE